jgi:hypothetical protein
MTSDSPSGAAKPYSPEHAALRRRIKIDLNIGIAAALVSILGLLIHVQWLMIVAAFVVIGTMVYFGLQFDKFRQFERNHHAG